MGKQDTISRVCAEIERQLREAEASGVDWECETEAVTDGTTTITITIVAGVKIAEGEA